MRENLKPTIASAINYTSTDFETLRADIVDLIPKLTPEWTNANETDLGITLVNVFCGIADMLSYYLNEQAKESYLPTSRLRQSVIDITNTIGYRLARPTSASVDIELEFTQPFDAPFTLNEYDVFTTTHGETEFVVAKSMVILPTDTKVTVPLLQGIPKEERFISTGEAIQRYPLSSTKISENMITAVIANDNTEYEELYKDIYLEDKNRRYFFIETDAMDNSHIVFSEVYGVIPPQGKEIVVKYLETEGARGMTGAGLITKTRDNNLLPEGTIIRQTTGATNGAEKEDKEFAKLQAPREIRTLWRAVTTSDYKTLLDGYPGVLSSNVFDHEDEPDIPIHQVVCIVAPRGGGALSQQFRADLREFLNRIRMATVDVDVRDARYVEVEVDVDIYVHKNYDQKRIVLLAQEALESMLALGEHDFGEPVRFSQIISTIQSIPGVSYVQLNKPSTDVLISPYEMAMASHIGVRVAGEV